MARKRKKSNELIRRVLIIGGTLAALQIGFILYFGQSTSPTNIRDEIDRQLKTVPAAEREIIRVKLALNDYFVEKGSFPKTLDELKGKYFDAVPMDPSTKKQIRYVLLDSKKYELGEPKAASLAKTGDRTADGKSSADDLTPEQQTALIASLDKPADENAFVYDPTGKRDPFRPFDLSNRIDPEACAQEPLTCFDIGQLKLTAVLAGLEQPTATVEDASGRGFIVRKGSRIGINGGEVIEILPDRLKILETTTDFTGETKTNVIEMQLRSKDLKSSNAPRNNPSSGAEDSSRRLRNQ